MKNFRNLLKSESTLVHISKKFKVLAFYRHLDDKNVAKTDGDINNFVK